MFSHIMNIRLQFFYKKFNTECQFVWKNVEYLENQLCCGNWLDDEDKVCSGGIDKERAIDPTPVGAVSISLTRGITPSIACQSS